MSLDKPDGFDQKNWRDIAEEVQTEKDPSRIIELVQHLLSKLDEEYPSATVLKRKETSAGAEE